MKYKFTPLIFLSSLGAGGISIIPFAFLQYAYPHEKGLVKISDISFDQINSFLFYLLSSGMIVFSIIHFVLSFIFFKQLIGFLKNSEYENFINNPLKHSAILAPFISIIMTMNVFIGPVRFFIESMANNLQLFMLPALVFWFFIFILLVRMEIKLLKISFEQGFDVNKINFGWLLHPFALGMLTVTGTGIAALSKNADVAHIAFFLSLISGSMGLFLFLVKIISIFKKHFSSDGLGEKQFFPSFLIVIPNITLYAIAFFRIGHYLEHYHGAEFDVFYLIVTTVSFAFETWYLIFGLFLMSNYLKNDFKEEFSITQWGLICPFVAYAVLSSFVYYSFLNIKIFYYISILFFIISAVLYFMILIKNMQCDGIIKRKINCE